MSRIEIHTVARMTGGLLLLVAVVAHAQISSFQHIVVIVQENRTPDNLFQGLCARPFGTSASCSTVPTGSQYDIQTSDWLDKNVSGGTIQPGTVPLGNNYDLNHGHSEFTAMCDADESGVCRMDGAGGVACTGTCYRHPLLGCPRNRPVERSAILNTGATFPGYLASYIIALGRGVNEMVRRRVG